MCINVGFLARLCGVLNCCNTYMVWSLCVMLITFAFSVCWLYLWHTGTCPECLCDYRPTLDSMSYSTVIFPHFTATAPQISFLVLSPCLFSWFSNYQVVYICPSAFLLMWVCNKHDFPESIHISSYIVDYKYVILRLRTLISASISWL